jgi:hypothetical protein
MSAAQSFETENPLAEPTEPSRGARPSSSDDGEAGPPSGDGGGGDELGDEVVVEAVPLETLIK